MSNFFDFKLCLKFTHDVVYGNISFIFIIIEYSFEWSHDHVLNHSTNSRYLNLFPVLDYYKYNGANYHDDDFGKSVYYDFCVFNSWSFILIFLMVCCTSMSQVTHLRFDLSTFFYIHVMLFQTVSSIQPLSHVWLFATPWTAACQAFLSFTISWSLLKLISIESVKPSSHLILYCPLLLLPSVFLSFRVFSNESVLPIM